MATPAKLSRRLAAMIYDVFLLLSVLFFATMLILPLHHGHAIAPHDPVYSAFLVIVSYVFYGWFWTHAGQTLGMRAWKLRVQTFDGRNIGWWSALLRFLMAIPSWALLGTGFLWILVDKDSLAWHDRFSQTVIVHLK